MRLRLHADAHEVGVQNVGLVAQRRMCLEAHPEILVLAWPLAIAALLRITSLSARLGKSPGEENSAQNFSLVAAQAGYFDSSPVAGRTCARQGRA